MTPSRIALVAVLALGGTAASAATFGELDTDRNGLLTVDEFTAAYGDAGQAAFERYDTDGSGGVTLREIAAGTSRQTETGDGNVTFGDLDTNGDGVIDRGEMVDHFGPRAQTALARFDANGDGYVTLNEVRSSDDPVGERGRGRTQRAGGSDDSRTSAGRDARGGGNGNSGGNRGGGNGNSGGNNGNGKGNGRG